MTRISPTHFRFVVGAIGLIALSGRAISQPRPQATIPVNIELRRPPAWSYTPGGTRLIQELHITNFWSEALDVVSVDVINARTGTSLRRYAGTLLLANALTFGDQPDSLRTVRLQPGREVIVYLNVAADTLDAPASLQYNVECSTVGRAKNTSTVFRTTPVTIAPIRPVVVGMPLREGSWAVFLGPDTMRTDPHNQLLVGVNAKVMSPQRFAIDLVKLGPDGRIWHDTISRNSNWPGFGADVLAVAPGIVVEAVDSLSDNTPPDYRRGSANRIVLDIGNQRYVTYAHLKQASLRVRAGQRVLRGEVLAEVGNSGNSSGPHLHFQMTDAASALAAEGVPYVFERYVVLGKLTESAEAYERGARWQPGYSQLRQGMLPDNGDVLSWVAVIIR